MIKVMMPGGDESMIDDVDADLAKIKWCLILNHKNRYASFVRKHQHTKYLHRIIMGRILGRSLESIEQVDHINGDGLDNQRSNLRIANTSQNCANGKKRRSVAGKPTTSIYKGVCWRRWPQRSGKWLAQIQINNKRAHLGYFKTEIEAARCYDINALKYYGEFANINFPKDDYLG